MFYAIESILVGGVTSCLFGHDAVELHWPHIGMSAERDEHEILVLAHYR